MASDRCFSMRTGRKQTQWAIGYSGFDAAKICVVGGQGQQNRGAKHFQKHLRREGTEG